jgi:hypothetical protein
VQIYVHWAVREYCQLATLAELTPRLLCPGYESKVTIQVHAYVTQGTKADASSLEAPRLTVMEDALEHSTVQPMKPQVRTGSFHVKRVHSSGIHLFLMICLFESLLAA